MRAARSTGRNRSSLLDGYCEQLGRLTDRRMATAALVAARQESDRRARQAHQAMLEARASADALREEMGQRMQVQSRLAYLANHDPLTGLANRALLHERLGRELERARRYGTQLALLCLDLDHFKDVNDTLGHAAGDMLLREVGHRLEACLRHGDLVARMGGDEFSILQHDLGDLNEARALAQRVIESLRMPVDLAEQRIFIGASVGIALFPGDGDDADLLLRNADLALYRTKRDGRNGYYFYDTGLNDEVRRRSSLEQALHEALPRGQLTLAYQPQIEVATSRLTGVEALLRWHHPEHGVVSPEEFVPIAERCGLINGIGTWVLGESCRQAAGWEAAGLPPLRVAVNVATAQFKGGDVPRLVADVLRQTGLPPSRLELEITESGVMHDIRDAVSILSALHALGVTLAIDDFGTGYSSLSYLRRLPVDKIKVDRSFVADVTHNEDAATVARTIVTLGHSLRLQVVAEGVETEAHARHVRMIRCDYGQGFFYGEPAAVEQLIIPGSVTTLARGAAGPAQPVSRPYPRAEPVRADVV